MSDTKISAETASRMLREWRPAETNDACPICNNRSTLGEILDDLWDTLAGMFGNWWR